MARNLDPKCKQCRRLGEKLFLRGDRCSSQKCAMIKRNYPPGVHGPKGMRKKQNVYGLQLAEKQKLVKQYGMMEKQFRSTFEKAKKQAGDTVENFLTLLECRLDNAVFRSGFAKSRAQARQIVLHGHIEVNGRKVNIASYTIKQGDVFGVRAIRKQAKAFTNLDQLLKKYTAPGWMNLDADKLATKVLHKPTAQDLEHIKINAQMIVEFYSK